MIFKLIIHVLTDHRIAASLDMGRLIIELNGCKILSESAGQSVAMTNYTESKRQRSVCEI